MSKIGRAEAPQSQDVRFGAKSAETIGAPGDQLGPLNRHLVESLAAVQNPALRGAESMGGEITESSPAPRVDQAAEVAAARADVDAAFKAQEGEV